MRLAQLRAYANQKHHSLNIGVQGKDKNSVQSLTRLYKESVMNSTSAPDSIKDLISEQYILALENNEPSHFSMRANIIDHLTYDDVDNKGFIIQKRLSVFAIHLYSVIRSVAGHENVCWKDTRKLAELANMSPSTVSECKKELQKKFHQLDGNPLIVVTEHKKSTFKDGNKINGYSYHKILVKNIWNYNRAFFLLKKAEKHQKEACSPDEHEGEARSPEKQALQGACSPGERNNTTAANTPLSKEQHSTAAADSVCSSNEEDNVSVSPETKWFNFLLQVGFNVLAATNIIKTFSIEEIRSAGNYTDKMIEKLSKKNQKISNQLGYFKNVLENKYWLREESFG
jgi:hypothetical protein